MQFPHENQYCRDRHDDDDHHRYGAGDRRSNLFDHDHQRHRRHEWQHQRLYQLGSIAGAINHERPDDQLDHAKQQLERVDGDSSEQFTIVFFHLREHQLHAIERFDPEPDRPVDHSVG